MARNIFANITQRGTMAKFQEKISAAPNVWKNHCQIIPSDGPDEEHVWMGHMPQPREFIHGRSFQGLRDFTYNVANKEYELSFLIDQTSLEDDRHGLINRRIADAAEVWSGFHDYLFAALLTNGATAGYTTYNGTTFFNDAHTIGAAVNQDNNLTRDVAITTAPVIAEARLIVADFIAAFGTFQDDTGRANYTAQAMTKKRMIAHSQYEQVMTELFSSNLVGGGDSNPFFQNLMEFDALNYLTAATVTIYATVVGAERMPFIYQDRQPLQIIILNGANDVAQNHGVMVLCRQRFRMWYNEPRYCCQNVMT